MGAHAQESGRPAPLSVLPTLAPITNAPFVSTRPGPLAIAFAFLWAFATLSYAALTSDFQMAVLLVVAVVLTSILAAEDTIGRVTLVGLLGPLAVLLLGVSVGGLVALGVVLVGDGVVRREPLTTVAWHAALLTVMLTAGGWMAGAGDLPVMPEAGARALGAAWIAIFVAWAAARQRVRLDPLAIAAALFMIVVMVAALTSGAWMTMFNEAQQPWLRAGLRGLGFASAFMAVDLVIASAASVRTGGWQAPRFWLDHLPVLFVRYGAQALIAGLLAEWYARDGIAVLAVALGVALTAQLVFMLYRRTEETTESAIAALASAIDARDPYTAGHSTRVAEYSTLAATHLGWSRAKVRRTQRAGLLHDIGKLGVSDAVLHKPGGLSKSEFDHMKRHASFGEQIVGQVRGLHEVARIVGQDHEHWAGGGYPRGLSGAQIREEARLIAVADVFDAMSTDRPYRPALPVNEVNDHLKQVAGSQLDPEITAAFTRAMKDGSAAGVSFCFCATH